MDPDATLAMLKDAEGELRRLRAAPPDRPCRARDIRDAEREIRQLRADLDRWIARGGYRPRGY